MFVPDKHRRVTCVRTCAAVWPPLELPAGAKPIAKGGVKAALLGIDPDPQGGRVVTYAGWPLYTYVADKAPGRAMARP
jgi:predicted lipoprotein with Yx(FWY)xxD motif